MTLFRAAPLLSLLIFSIRSYASASVAHHAQIKRNASDLLPSYDYIVIGGGTSGLTMANRLTEDASKTVLVVELGYVSDDPCIYMPENGYTVTNLPCSRYEFNETTVPQPGLNGLSIEYVVGAVVGGSSAVNGMFFDRATKRDYDAWEDLGNPGWGWDGLLPYFKKSTTFTPPSQQDAKRYGYTWDADAYGEGPIQASYPLFQWDETKIMFDAWQDLNVSYPKEAAFGNAIGVFWVPTSEDPVNRTRSYARWGYYEPARSRSNYHILVGHKAEKLVLSSNLTATGALIYDRTTSGQYFVVNASGEVILAAGAAHTPQLLQLSGIGPKNVLEGAGVKVKVELPGVGQNFQDHAQATLACNFTKDSSPNPTQLVTNATFAAAALAEYQAQKTGPLTLALGNSAAFLPLKAVDPHYSQFLKNLYAQAPGTYLAPNVSVEVIAGYEAQQRVLTESFTSIESATYERPFSGGCTGVSILQKPLSRGSINIDPLNPIGPPLIDHRTYSNPLDIWQAISFILYTRRYIHTPTLASLGPVELAPGANLTWANYAELEAYVRATSYPTSFHAAGTAAMMPRELGGVVGSDLRVHGAQKLSVVDASIMPLIPGTHLSATVYAIAEKAADIIKARS